MTKYLIKALFLYIFSSTVICLGATYQDAVEAYKMGEYDKASNIWLELADVGDPKSQREIAFMYQQGKGVQQNYKKAVFWYTKAANQGNRSAQFNLATMYRFGKGVQVDTSLALKWYLAAAYNSHQWAQMELGSMYRLGEGIKKDLNQAFFWLSLASRNGNTKAERLKILISKKLSPEEIDDVKMHVERCLSSQLRDCID